MAAWIDIIVNLAEPYRLRLRGFHQWSSWLLHDLYRYGDTIHWRWPWCRDRLRLDGRAKSASTVARVPSGRGLYRIAIWTVGTNIGSLTGALGASVSLWSWRRCRWRASAWPICLISTALFLVLGYAAKLPRTQRHYEGVAAAGV